MKTFSEFLKKFKESYPSVEKEFPEHLPQEALFCMTPLVLHSKILEQAKSFISLVFKLKNHPTYQKKILGYEKINSHDSVLMSFDFHLSQDQLKLIEINTNASHALTTAFLLDFLEPNRAQFLNPQGEILKSFYNEYQLFSQSSDLGLIAIADDSLLQQKAFFEFIMYKDLFLKNGLSCEIVEAHDISYKEASLRVKNQPISLLYNRTTDFYLDQHPQLKEAYQNKSVCITPHPEEYQLLADKNRLLDFRNSNFLSEVLSPSETQSLFDVIPRMEILRPENFEDIWANRKDFFFKPAQSYGSKSAYRGSSVSKTRLLASMDEQAILAQEFIPAPTTEILLQEGPVQAKFDLRFYVYNGEVQLVAARTYLGQLTNFKTLGLGLTPVLFHS